MAYKHGVCVVEQETSLATPIVGSAGLQVVFGTAPINILADPDSAVNKLIIAHSFAEAVEKLGYNADYSKYTLCQSMDASFKLFSVAPVIFCNVLDPKKHTDDVNATECTIADGQAVLKVEGMLLDKLAVTVGEENTALSADIHYVASFDDEGNVVVTLTADGTTVVAENTIIKIGGKKIDPSKVTANDIIGGIGEGGKETGLELIRQVYPIFNLTPGLIIAPGWSHIPSVGAAIQAKCIEINSMFSCECLLDISTSDAKVYTEVAAVKEANAYINKHAIVCWPMASYAGKIFYYSAVLAAMIAYTDAQNDDVPNLSPSNKVLGISGAVLADGTEVNLDKPQANVLNGDGIVTIIRMNGWRSWGNNMACYPANKDPKDRWICCRRFFSWQGNTFIRTFNEKVDSPANYRLIESIIDDENIRGNSLVAQGKVAGMRIEYNLDENPISQVIDGTIKFHQYLAPFTPAQTIENTLEFSPSMLEASLNGGEE